MELKTDADKKTQNNIILSCRLTIMLTNLGLPRLCD